MEKILEELFAKWQTIGKRLEITNNFKKLETDQDRVIFTLKIMQQFDIIPNATGKPKDAKDSDRLREQGNTIFINCGPDKNNIPRIEALKLYTKSIAFAPYPSLQLALAYANRSAVLFELNLCFECVQDIDRALSLGYPDDLKAKLYLRKTHCLILLRNQSAEDMIKETEQWLSKMSLNKNKEKLQTKFDVLQKILKTKSNTMHTQCNDIKQEKLENELPLPIIMSPNSEIPCVSNSIALTYNEMYGRHVVATRDILPGEIIAVEEPYSLLLVQEKVYTHCSNCLEVCWANIPCKYCTYAMYCSEKCRDIEWKKCHDVECAVFPVLIEEHICLNTDLFSMRLAVLAIKEAGNIKELRTMLSEIDKCDDPRKKGFSQDGKLHSNKYISLYSLVRNSEKRSVSDLFRRSMDTSFILYVLATRTTIFGTSLPEDFSILTENNDVTFIGSLILRHQQIIPNNIHTFSEVQGLDSSQRGMAALPFCSLLNHSCEPNIVRCSNSTHEVIYAMYPIKKGDQILDNYGEHYAMTPKATRQRNLRKTYFFLCDCIACQEDWPLYLDLKSFQTLVKKPNDKAKIKKALKKFNRYVDLAMDGNVLDKPSIVKDLLMMIQVLHDCAPMPCEEMNNVVETLKRIYDLSGNKFEMPKVMIFDK